MARPVIPSKVHLFGSGNFGHAPSYVKLGTPVSADLAVKPADNSTAPHAPIPAKTLSHALIFKLPPIFVLRTALDRVQATKDTAFVGLRLMNGHLLRAQTPFRAWRETAML